MSYQRDQLTIDERMALARLTRKENSGGWGGFVVFALVCIAIAIPCAFSATTVPVHVASKAAPELISQKNTIEYLCSKPFVSDIHGKANPDPKPLRPIPSGWVKPDPETVVSKCNLVVNLKAAGVGLGLTFGGLLVLGLTIWGIASGCIAAGRAWKRAHPKPANPGDTA